MALRHPEHAKMGQALLLTLAAFHALASSELCTSVTNFPEPTTNDKVHPAVAPDAFPHEGAGKLRCRTQVSSTVIKPKGGQRIGIYNDSSFSGDLASPFVRAQLTVVGCFRSESLLYVLC